MSQTTRAAVYRAAPVAVGTGAGILSGALAPSHAEDGFYSTAAQVLPVLLLALAIEARVFGGGLRRFPDEAKLGRMVERLRWAAGFWVVLVLVGAEWCAVDALMKEGGTRDPAIVYLALGSGFVTVGLLAFGGAKPRAVAELGWKPHDRPHTVIVRAAMGNQYGDKDVTPLMKLLVPAGSVIHRCAESGKLSEKRPLDTLTATEPFEEGDEPMDWAYTADRPLLTVGDAHVAHYRIELSGKSELRVKLRLDHGDLRGGRVEDKMLLTSEEIDPPPQDVSEPLGRASRSV